MPHLVEPIKRTLDNLQPIAEALRDIQEAHHYLVEQGIQASLQASKITDIQNWGSLTKRIKIILPDGNRPKLIPNDIPDQSLIEVINQCATMERLMDALNWAMNTLPNYHVLLCHPTTSSNPKDNDHDIVLQNPDNGRLALFEVSDVARNKDSNGKEEKDLESLGVRLAKVTDYPDNQNLFSNRLFMVVSFEFGHYIMNRLYSTKYYDKSQPYFRYDEPVRQGNTYIFEVKEK